MFGAEDEKVLPTRGCRPGDPRCSTSFRGNSSSRSKATLRLRLSTAPVRIRGESAWVNKNCTELLPGLMTLDGAVTAYDCQPCLSAIFAMVASLIWISAR